MFQNMLATLNERTVQALMRGKVYLRPPQQQQSTQATSEQTSIQVDRPMPRTRPDSEYKTSKATLPSEEEAQRRAAAAPRGPQTPTAPIKAGPKIGRNDPCPCGSGKKYKNCHGAGK